MRILLDSHVLLWWVLGQQSRLSSEFRAAMARAASAEISVATIWELEIKRNAGKLTIAPDFWESVARRGIGNLPVDREDALAAAALPLLHRDPFDHMIIAQARRRALTLVSADAAFAAYDVALLGP